MEKIWLRQSGDAWAVDSSYMRQIYIARPEKGMDDPLKRATEYLRVVAKHYNLQIVEGK